MDQKKGFKKFLCGSAGRFVMIVLFYVVLLGIVIGLVNAFDNTTVPMFIVAAVLGYFGWQALSRITPDIFLIMPIGGWLIYFLIKGILAILIGAFVAPFVLAKKIADAIQSGMNDGV